MTGCSCLEQVGRHREAELLALRDENVGAQEENQRLRDRIALLEERLAQAEAGPRAPSLKVVKLRPDEEREDDDEDERPSKGKRITIKIHESAKSLPPDAWGHPQKPFNFTKGKLKGGGAPADVYRTFMTGLNGTAMPSFYDIFAEPDGEYIKPGDDWNLVAYVRSLRTKGAP